jgi:hypothetical protein
MPKRSRNPADPNTFAANLIRIIEDGEDATPKPKKKNAAAVALGRKGGLKGGRARAEKMTDAERRESARKAAKARWNAQKS